MSEHAADLSGAGTRTGTVAGTVTGQGIEAVAGVAAEHPVVADVVASLEALDELPVTEHAARFETAHQRLRATLDEAPPA